jgi:predicted nuclease of predicted toxin-antitoxin system
MLDEDILNYAQRNNFILITNDKDFGEFVLRQKKMTKGLILFRFENQKAIEKIPAIQFVLEHHQDKIANHFVVLSPKKVRFIPLEVYI